MKAGKLAIRPWLSCPYTEHMLVDLPSSVVDLEIQLEINPISFEPHPPNFENQLLKMLK